MSEISTVYKIFSQKIWGWDITLFIRLFVYYALIMMLLISMEVWKNRLPWLVSIMWMLQCY